MSFTHNFVSIIDNLVRIHPQGVRKLREVILFFAH